MLEQVHIIDITEYLPPAVAKDVKELVSDIEYPGNGSYHELGAEDWDGYPKLGEYLADNGLVPEDRILILIWW